MREKEIEQKLVREVKRRGGICPKFVSPGANGMPDRIVLLRDGCMGFAEVKSPGKKPRALQVKRHSDLRKLGHKVFVIDDAKQIAKMIKEIEAK